MSDVRLPAGQWEHTATPEKFPLSRIISIHNTSNASIEVIGLFDPVCPIDPLRIASGDTAFFREVPKERRA